ncbi:MAG: hypothetical protein GX756_06880 [Clostridiales bacterium]|nr:hypothetical protein [Clostridiales bacterium]
MRYIAKKDGKNDKKQQLYAISGIKPMSTPDGQEVEVIIDTIKLSKENIEKTIEDLNQQHILMVEKYKDDVKNLTDYQEAINQSK